MKNYHCCATCTHFHVERTGPKKILSTCTRLGYETKPSYRFNCWSPRPDIAIKITMHGEPTNTPKNQ